MRILYIDCDSLRPDHIGCYGYQRETSPNIDRLAADGRRYTNYYSSDVPCLPSRTALLSGRFGIHTGVVNHGGIAADMQSQGPRRREGNNGRYRTWPAELGQNGYHTAFISPFPQRHAAWHVLDGFHEWHDTKGDGNERAEVISPYAELWLDEHADDEDWFLHVNFWDPHTHYDTPIEYGNPFEDDPAPKWLTEDIISDQRKSFGPHSARDLHHGYMTGDGSVNLPRVPDEIRDRETFEQWIDGYDVGIRYMDDFVGKLLDQLETTGVLAETLVIISADHGENQGELNVYGDHHLADEWTCRVPLVMHGPGVEPGVDDSFHYNVDLPPTVIDLIDGDVPAGWDGESFVDNVTAGTDDGRDFLVLSQGTWTCQRSVRWDDWLLIQTYHNGWHEIDSLSLFDLATDPHETKNIAKDRPAVVEQGISLLQRWYSNRVLENATGKAGGTPGAKRALSDPLIEVVHEGLPFYQRGNRETYAERLRETNREEFVDQLKPDQGVQLGQPEIASKRR